MKQLKKYNHKKVRLIMKDNYQTEGLVHKYYDEVKNPQLRADGAMQYYIERECGDFELIHPKDIFKIELL